MTNLARSGLDCEALILAGGKGERLRSVVSDKPKVLAPVGGRPFITYLLDELDRQGVSRAVLCTGVMADQVSATLGFQWKGVELCYSVESAPLGTGGALRRGAGFIQTTYALAMNGDSWCGFELDELLTLQSKNPDGISMVLTRVADGARFGSVRCSEVGTITAFEEKSTIRRENALINAGVYLAGTTWFRKLPDTIPLSFENDVLPNYVSRGLLGLEVPHSFIDIGTPDCFRIAQSGEWKATKVDD